MYCPNCNAALPPNSAYCTRCGTRQTTPYSQAQVAQQPFPAQVSYPSQAQATQQPSPSQTLSLQDYATQKLPFQQLPSPQFRLQFMPSPTPSNWAPQQQEPWASLKNDVTDQEHQHQETGEKQEEHGEHGHEEHETHDNERLLIFSDGIIAFALTVAAITIKIPTTKEELLANAFPIFLRSFMYVIAFIIVASAWNDHHSIFHHIKRNDIVLVSLNFLYLIGIVMFPIGLFFLEFGFELFSVNQDALAENQVLLGAAIFLGSQILVGLALFLMWFHAKGRSHLLADELEPRFVSYMNLRLLSKPAMLIFLLICVVLAFYAPLPMTILMLVVWIARSLYFRRAKRGLDLSVGNDDTDRIQLFSDAVIGIAITLAVAQIEFPSLGEDGKNAAEAVNNQGPLLHAFLVGIVIMGIYWLFHYHLFRLVGRHDGQVIFFNCFFLLDMALMIIPINSLVNYYKEGAYSLFGFWQVMTSLTLLIMWWHASHKGRFLAPHVSPIQIKRFSTMVIAQPVIFVVLTIVASYIPNLLPSAYIGLYLVLIGCVWLVSQKILTKKPPTQLQTWPGTPV